MPLLKSLFCLKGYDNRFRFLSIVSISVLCLLFFTAFFDNLIIAIIFLSSAASTLTLSTLRRAKDAQLASLPFVIAGISAGALSLLPIVFSSNWAYLPMLIATGFIFSLLTYPSKAVKKYILGYHGPTDLSSFNKTSATQQKARIEPTFATSPAGTSPESILSDNTQYNRKEQQTNEAPLPTDNGLESDLGIKTREFVLHYKVHFIVMFCAVILIAMIFTFLQSPQEPDTNNTDTLVENHVEKKTLERLHSLVMPDDFTLMATQYDGLIIHWQADNQDDGIYWQQLTAESDKSCKEITFNNGDSIRTIEVSIENSTEYFAHFSPLDTAELLNQIAFRGNFSLCGYAFSLKGSQSTLGRHPYYTGKVEY